jgi:hypothetical protein
MARSYSGQTNPLSPAELAFHAGCDPEFFCGHAREACHCGWRRRDRATARILTQFRAARHPHYEVGEIAIIICVPISWS